MLSFPSLRVMRYLIVTDAMTYLTIPIFRRNASLVTSLIIIILPTQIIWRPIFLRIVWNAILPGLIGSLRNSEYMTPNFSQYSQESITMNGTLVPIATAILPTILFLPVSTAMSTTNQRWMISIRMKLIMNIAVLHVWIATLLGMRTRAFI